ncbi:MAG: methylenetetrahydrofolate reductase [Candidatus Nanopelagicaceae bacterium]|nr:methylenetetrahydrofolate reductase [Candidatus Nanopelagicaceae bacterium]
MSTLRDLLENSIEKVFTSELPTIDGAGMPRLVTLAQRLAPWFDAVNATDNPAAHAHASNTSVAIALQAQGIEPIMQIACRDKNRLAIQADMMGASLHGIANLSLMTGDDVTAGDEPETRRVFDLDSSQAISIAHSLNGGKYLSGRNVKPPTDFYIGAVENAAAPPFDYRIQRALKKHRAGARFLQLQICYHPNRLENFCAGVATVAPKLHLLPTIVLLKGAKQLNFMNQKVAGIDVPVDVIQRVEKNTDPSEAAYTLALEQARHALSLPSVRGIHIADFRHDETLARLMTDLGRTPRTISKQLQEQLQEPPCTQF